MATSSLVDLQHSPVTFLSLPRELRDLVYRDHVISSQPICFNRRSGPIVNDIDNSLLRMWDSSDQVAREACEIFYSHNTFVIFDGDLSSFFGSNIRSWTIHYPYDVSRRMHAPNWNLNTALAKVEIFQELTAFTDYQELGNGLCFLLTCPRVQSVVIDTRRGFWRKLDEKSKMAIDDLSRRLDGGLKVHMEGSGYGGAC
ncbi:hypothetical protein N7G274_010484 [Stereocaulon virgatum]|uniref:Uncharacterized protein n=1 Tax=Stereocaulon virgatum TaxID=373712 RepID=A0ABR3ZUH7_9LECA